MHVAVTGASSGIGAAIAREYLRRGADVTVVARRRELLEKLASEGRALGRRVHVVAADLSETARVTEWIAPAEAALGPIDVLVNNAALELTAPTDTVAWEKAEGVLRLNVHAPMKLTLALLPRMIARRAGTIVDICSVAALAPTPGMYVYNATKGAHAGASESLRAEVRPFGVHVLTVYPGPIHTDMGHRSQDNMQPTFGVNLLPWGTPERLAALVARGVERRKARIIYPWFYTIARWFPALARRLTDSGAKPRRDATTDMTPKVTG